MIKIEVTDEVREIKWTKNGERKQMLAQVCYAHIPGDKYPTKIEVLPAKGEPPYAAGVYVLAPESITVQDGRLTVRPKLLTQSAAAARVPRASAAG